MVLFPTPRFSSYWKRSLRVTLAYACQLYLLTVFNPGGGGKIKRILIHQIYRTRFLKWSIRLSSGCRLFLMITFGSHLTTHVYRVTMCRSVLHPTQMGTTFEKFVLIFKLIQKQYTKYVAQNHPFSEIFHTRILAAEKRVNDWKKKADQQINEFPFFKLRERFAEKLRYKIIPSKKK